MKLPQHLDCFVVNKTKKMKINSLIVVLRCKDNFAKYVNVTDTPHYRNVINFESGGTKNTEEYENYRKKYIKDSNSDSFYSLYTNIKNIGYDERNKVLIYRNLKIFKYLFRWFVADGFHRLSILYALGFYEIETVLLSRKKRN